MAETTGIQWTDSTFNIAWGCTKVSPGCKNCYADTQSHRYGFDVWGPGTPRRTFGAAHWNEPVKWNKKAAQEGKRHRVFCSSMCDVFEDHPTLFEERQKLWKLIEETPMLDWQLLTKRPKNFAPMLPWLNPKDLGGGEPFPNVWLGVSVEDQQRADERIPILLQTPAAVRFLSVEPLLAEVNLRRFFAHSIHCKHAHPGGGECQCPRISWVIVGGESGPGARPMQISWARSLVKQCREASVACFVKQLGRHVQVPTSSILGQCGKEFCDLPIKDKKGGAMEEWPADLRVRQFPNEQSH